MRTLSNKITVLFCFMASLGSAMAASPSRESIDELLILTDVQKLIYNLYAQIDGTMLAYMQRATEPMKLSPEERQIVDEVRAKMFSDFKDKMSWARISEEYFEVYKTTFTQEEVDGLIEFYKSSAGKALMTKMPGAMERSMAIMRERLVPIMKTMQETISETASRIDRERKTVKRSP